MNKIDSFSEALCKKVFEYARNLDVSDFKWAKVLFLGLNMYPNIQSIINWDIVHVYKYLQEEGIKCRLHDPHIRGSEGLSMGLWMGRHSGDEKWSYSYDVLVLSCPHLYYLQNIQKLGNLLDPDKPCAIVDIYGAFTKLYGLGNSIDIINFRAESEKAELLGGLINDTPAGYLN